MTKKDLTGRLIKAGVRFSRVSKKRDGSFVIYKIFYLRRGFNDAIYAEELKKKIPEVSVLCSGEVYKEFECDQKSSYFYVNFNIQ